MRSDMTVTPEVLAASVIAVPPLARNADYSINPEANAAIVRHMEAGGMRTLLYGGNANFYHIGPAEYADVLAMIAEISGPRTLVIPSAGPAYGLMLWQAIELSRQQFPTAMVLPQMGVKTSAGIATGFRHFVEAFGKPGVLYIKDDPFLDVADVKRVVDDGLVSAIKYAVVRNDPAKDDYLRALLGEAVDRRLVVSGIGEQPAVIHLRDFKLQGFTTGCGCVAPALSNSMLWQLQAGNIARAEELREIFKPLEDLRNAINPIRVLHEAIALAGIAPTGPILPLLSNLEEQHHQAVRDAACTLLAEESGAR